MTLTPNVLETIVRIIQDSAVLNGIDIYSIPEDKVDEILKRGLNNALIDVSKDDYKRIKNEFEYKCHRRGQETIGSIG